MSTPDILPAAVPDAAPGAFPDPAVLARMANSLFAALPGRPDAAAASVPTAVPAGVPTLAPAPLPAGATPPLPAPSFAAAAVPTESPHPSGLPSDTDLARLPHTLGGALSLVSPLPMAGPPAVPSEALYFLGALGAADSAGGLPGRAVPTEFPALPAEIRPELVALSGPATRPFDARAVRRDFPILQETVHGRPLVWLDNAATTQKPRAVIDRLSAFYEHENSNIHRGAHALAARATDAYEAARTAVRRFLNAGSVEEIVFVRGATEAINLVAQSWGVKHVGRDDEIVVTQLEHHANIVPWQQLCAATGARLRVVPVDDRGQVLLDAYDLLLGPRTKLVAFTQVSNALGTVTPAKAMIDMAHRHGARVLLDGAQAVSHMAVDVQALGCDFYVFSGHKVFAPTGIGALYGRSELLEAMPPWQGGGNMIADVTFERTVYQPPPARFEAGTGNIADAVGLGAAIDYVQSIGMDVIARYEHELLDYATRGLLGVPGLRLIGTAADKAGVLSFVLDGHATEEVGRALDREGIAVRSGHHCAQPILRRFGLESTVRPSLAVYNTCDDIDALVAALHRLQANRGSPIR